MIPRTRLGLETRAFVKGYEAPKRCQSYARALEVLADRMDSAGRIRMEHARLGRAIGLQERQTQNVVHALEQAGMLRIVAQRGFANLYRVLVDWVLRLIAGESVTAAGEMPAPVPASPSPGELRTSEPTHPPPIFGRWVFANGGCIHGGEACDECRAKQR